MFAEKRHREIVTILEKETVVKVKELSILFNVSLETIRRDLEILDKNKYLKKVYGGAILLEKDISNLKFNERKKEKVSEKNEIAQLAIRYIVEKDIITINGGTTNLEIAKLLKNKFSNLTVITNSLSVANILAEDNNIKLLLIGGLFNPKENSFYGNFSYDIIKKFNSTKTFLSVGGIDLSIGITEFILEEVEIQKLMIKNTKQIIVVSDSSKFEKTSLGKIIELNKIDFIITDSNLPPSIYKKYTQKGIKIVNQ